MKNPYLVRTAAVASIAAALLSAGWMGLQTDDEMVMMSDAVTLSRASAEPVAWYPAGFQGELMPGSEAEPYEYQ